MSKNEYVEVSKRDIVAVVAIMVLMLSSLVYGYFLLKHEPAPAPMTCWEKYQDAGEDVAIRMCEVHDGE
jgi:hypothetical protein